MSIQHIEDLDTEAFIDAIRRLAKMEATEKLDGLNQYFGVDDRGQIFASYEGKRSASQRFYREADYPFYGANNVFRSALAAILEHKDIFLDIVQPGQTVIAEIVFGRQPNAVSYGAGGKNYIAFLGGADGTSNEVAKSLVDALRGKSASVTVKMVDTSDGKELTVNPVSTTYEFVGPQKLDSKKLAKVNVEPKLKALEAFLASKAELKELGLTNLELLGTPLTSIPKELRPDAKALRERVRSQVQLDFKLPIKKELLDKVVSKIKSPLAADDLTHDEDNGIEGIVVKDPASGEEFKIVDREGFKTIADFNRAVRAKVNGMVKTTDPDAPLESRGGILGELKIRLAKLLGNEDLARGGPAKKIFASIDAESVDDTIRMLAHMLKGREDPRGMIRKIIAMVTQVQAELAELLQDFKQNQKSYKLKLATGKEIGLSDEAIKRTLLVFAEANRELDAKLKRLATATTMQEVLSLFYGHLIKAAKAGGDELAEGLAVDGELLTEKRNYTHENLLAGHNGFSLLNAYLATLFMVAVLYRVDDKIGIRLIKDQKHQLLTGFSYDARPHNFWGYPVWRSNTPAVKKLIGDDVAADVWRVLKELPKNMWNQLHRDFSSGGNLDIDWDDHKRLLQLILEKFPGLYSQRVNSLLDGSWGYNELSRDGKIKFLTKLYYYVMQFVSTSPLLTRIRAIHRELLLNPAEPEPIDQVVPVTTTPSLLNQIITLAEEGEGGGEGAPAADSGSIGISVNTGAVASNPTRAFTGTITRAGNAVKIRRNKARVDRHKIQFKRPEVSEQ